MNILLIPNNDWINHPVPAQRHYRIFEELGKRHNVYVLQFDLFAKSGKATHVPKFTKIVHPFTVPVSNPAQFYLANLPFQTRKIFSTLKELDIDLVFGSNLAVCSLGFAAAKSLNVKTIFDLSDYFPESASAYFSEGSTALSSVVKYVSTFFTNFNIKLADICTTCSFTLRDYVKKISSDSRVEHLPNGVDLTNFKPKSSNERLRREFGLKENILVYVGSIESWMDFEMVLDALSILKLDGIEIQLLIVGRSIYSNEENPLVRSIRSRGLDEQVKFLGFKPSVELGDTLFRVLQRILKQRECLLGQVSGIRHICFRARFNHRQIGRRLAGLNL